MSRILDIDRLPGHDIPGTGRWLHRHGDLLRGAPWLTLFLGLAGYQFWLGFDYNSNDTTNIFLQLARGSAYLLLLLLAVLWLPVMRNGLSVLRRSAIGELLPLNQAKALHRWLGHLLMAAGLVHGSQYLLYFNTLEAPFSDVLIGSEADLVRSMRTTMYEFVSEDESIDIVADWVAAGTPRARYLGEVKPILKEDCTKCHSTSSSQTYAIPELPLTSYEETLALSREGFLSRQFRINISGLVMLALFSLVWTTSLKRVRRRHHHRFQRVHRLGYLLAALSLLHIPSMQWLAAPLLVLAIELYLSLHRHLYRHREARLTAVNDQIVRLEIDKPDAMPLLPGHYVQVRIPELSPREWHDFSLTGPRADNRQLTLKIRCLGDWTRELQRRLGDKTEYRLKVDVRGPYASPVAQATRKRDWLLIAGGIGITPFLSLLRELRHDSGERRRLHLVWITREPALLKWLRPLVERLCTSANIRCHWHLYLTTDADLTSIAQTFRSTDGKVPMEIRRGRPRWPELINTIADDDYTPACFICGPDALAREAGSACRKMGWSVIKEMF